MENYGEDMFQLSQLHSLEQAQKRKKLSKFLSLVLRHKPETINLQLDKNGWVNVTELLTKLNENGYKANMFILEDVVKYNDKKRFAFNDDKSMIRASQGHSVNIDLGLDTLTPPTILYHGTAKDTILLIKKSSGIKSMSRTHVHLSKDIETAFKVGKRHGHACVLIIDTERMYQDGYEFLQSENSVWLTKFVPTEYIKFDEIIYE